MKRIVEAPNKIKWIPPSFVEESEPIFIISSVSSENHVGLLAGAGGWLPIYLSYAELDALADDLKRIANIRSVSVATKILETKELT
jgi:hypothetical protein